MYKSSIRWLLNYIIMINILEMIAPLNIYNNETLWFLIVEKMRY